MKKATVGDKVKALGFVVTIGKILYQDYWEEDGWDIEFIDSEGQYRHWKQGFDGGELLRSIPTHFVVGESGGKYYDEDEMLHYLDFYGGDVTDLFKKYGML